MGVWWKNQEDEYRFGAPCIIFHSEDFTESEAKSLYEKFSESIKEIIKRGGHAYKTTDKFVVLVSEDGMVTLPWDKQGRKIRTLDTSLIRYFH